MAQTVKGITIEFNGDTTKLQTALRKVRDSAKDIDRDLRSVNNALKFNPRNAELLAQKQKLLSDRVKQTEQSLVQLQDAQKQLDNDPSVDKQSSEYMALRREIIETESKLKHYNAELQKTAAMSSRIYQVGQAFDDAGKKIESAGRALAPLSKSAGAVSAALGAVTYKAGAMADDLNTLSKQTGISTYDLQMYAAMADLVDVSVETMAKSNARLKKSMLGASEGGSQAKYFEQLGISVTDANGNLRDSNDVFQETITALGMMENETQRDAIAMAIFGRSANELNPLIEDAGATYEKVAGIMQKYGLEPVSQEELDKANEFNDTLDTIKLVFTQAVQIIGSRLAGYLVPIMQTVVDKAAQIAEFVAGLSAKTLATVGGISTALAALAPALVIVGKLAQLFGTMQMRVALLATRVPMIGSALGLLSNPIFLIVAGLTALSAIVMQTGLTADDITAKIAGIAALIQEKMPEIISTVVQVLTTLVQTIAEMAPVLVQGAVTLFTGLVQALPIILPVLMQGVADLIMAIVQSLPGMAVSLIQAAVSIAQTLWQGVRQVFSGVVAWFGSVFGQAWQAVKNKFAGWASFWGGLWQTISRKFSEIGTNIASAISGAVRSGVNGVISRIESIINSAVSIINGAINLINKIPGVSVGHVSTVSFPRLAKGGVLNGAQTVIAGEAGPEAIIPLDKLFAQMDKMAAQITGAGGGITINVFGAEGQSVRSLAEEVRRVLIQEENRRRMAWQ